MVRKGMRYSVLLILLGFLVLSAPAGGWKVSVDGSPLALNPVHAEQAGGDYCHGAFEVKGGERVTVTDPVGSNETFTADGPFKRVFARGGRNDWLVLFGDAPERNVPGRKDPKVKWFGPGVHDVGGLRLSDGETLYLERGAVIRGGILAHGRNITVAGRGTISGAPYAKAKGPFMFFTTFDRCTNLVIRGVTLTDAYHWTIALARSRQVLIDDVRILCGRVISDDGVDIVNSCDVTVRDSFIRTADDCIAVKGMDSQPDGRRLPCANMLVEDSILCADCANVFRIGFESNASEMRGLTVRNVTVYPQGVALPLTEYWVGAIFMIEPSNGMPMRDILFENIRIVNDGRDTHLALVEPRVCFAFSFGTDDDPFAAIRNNSNCTQYAKGGSIDGLTFRNVSVEGVRGKFRGVVRVAGRSAAESVRNVRFENVTRFGEPVTAKSPHVMIEGKYASEVTWK